MRKESTKENVDARKENGFEELKKIGAKMSFNINKNSIQKILRLGRKKKYPNSTPRPTLILFYTIESKMDFLSKRDNLKCKNVAITVTHDRS